MDIKGASLSAVDYCIFIVVVFGSLGIGVWTYFRSSNKSPEAFLMGNRTFGYFPVALSLLTSFISSIDILGYSGEAYAYGVQQSTLIVGAVFGVLVARSFILPVIYPLKITSANEYLELRFRSKNLRLMASLLTAVKIFAFMGIVLYAPAIALASATGISWVIYTVIMGLVVTVYSSIGGIRAVIYTDVFQVVVMFCGLSIIVVLGYSSLGGFVEAWQIASEGGRTELFNMNFGFNERHTFFNTALLGFFYNVSRYGVSQINIQRLCAVRTLEDAKKCLILNVFGLILSYSLVFSGGIIAYVTYAGCDPYKLGMIRKVEESFTYYVVDRLSYIPGLPGLFLATLIGGSLSSVSSMMNSLVAVLWRDVLLKMKTFSDLPPKSAARINKILSFIVGGLVIGMAILSSIATSLTQYSLSIVGIVFGSLFGVFMLGLLFPRCNSKGAFAGIVSSTAILMWIYIGARMYTKPPIKLPFSTDNCFEVGLAANTSSSDQFEVLSTTDKAVALDDDYEFPLMALYTMSYTLYPAVGTITCMVVGLIASFLTGNDDLDKVPINCIAPFVRRFYYSKEEVERQMRLDRSKSICSSVELIPAKKIAYLDMESNPD